MRKNILVLVILLFSGLQVAVSQCKIHNTFFIDGEDLTYDLYFKYGLINTKAGTSSLKVSAEKYKGKEAYKLTLLAETKGGARKLFSLNDTLTSYTTKEIVPLAYIKNAAEGKDYTQERVGYKYDNGKIDLNVVRHKNGEFKFDENLSSTECIYDLVSVVYYARTLEYANMNIGDNVAVNFITGKNLGKMSIEYKGIENMKGNNDRTYNCIVLVLNISDSAFKNKKEAMKVYLSNDANRIPVRLDSHLNFGSTRGIIKSAKGLRY